MLAAKKEAEKLRRQSSRDTMSPKDEKRDIDADMEQSSPQNDS